MKFEMLKIITTLVATIFTVRAQLPPDQVAAAAPINSGQVSQEPAIVGQQKAQLTVQFFTNIDIPIGSLIEVTVPGESTVVTDPGIIICAIAGWVDDDGLLCSAPDDKTLQFPVKHELKAFEQNVFRFDSAYNAPKTSEPTDSFIIAIYNADKSFVLAYVDSGIQLSPLNPNILRSVAIAQSGDSSTVVGAETQIMVSVTSFNPIPAGGGLKIEFPKWNSQAQEANRVSYIIQDSSPICSVSSGMLQITCDLIVTPTVDTLIVKNMFPDAQRDAGSTFAFVINRVRNPLSMSPVQFTLTTWSSILFEAVGLQVSFKGLIDQGPGTLKALLPAPMNATSSVINADDTTVSEQSQLIIPFKIPVPVQLELGCTILITLPEDFEVVDGKLTIFRGWGIFQGVSELVASVDQQQRTVKIADQCVKYSSANVQNTIRMGSVKNPALVKPTKEFKIQILDNNGMMIASVETGVTYTPTPGTFSAIALVPHSATVDIQEVTDVSLVFTPQHSLTTSGKLYIKMPSDLPGKCDIAATAGGIKLPLNCQLDPDGTIILLDPFANADSVAGQQLSITFRDLELPDSQRPILGISIESYDSADGQDYLVDRYQSLTYQFFTPRSIQFLQNSISRGTGITYTETQFRISSTLSSNVPAGSTLVMVIPKQVTINSEVSVMSSCNQVLNMDPDMICSIVANTDDSPEKVPDGSHTVTITGAFPTRIEKNSDVIFVIRRGLVTPISTQTTDTFKINIYDSMGFEVNYIKETLSMTMKQGRSIEQITIEPDSYRVGDTSDHTVTFLTPVPILEGFKLQIFVPQAVVTPRAADIVCVGVAPLVADLECQLNGNRVTMELRTLAPVSENTELHVKIGPMINPGSTFPTLPYGLSIRSDTWYEVAEELNHSGGKVLMKDPSIIDADTVSFEVFDLRQKALTTVTIDWTSTETYPKDTKIIINYDQTQISPNIASLDETVPCIFRQSHLVTCSFEYNQIFVNDIMPSEEYGNSKMQLTITNMKINVVTPLTTESWVLTTYLNDGISKIDQIPDNMSITFDCNYPCQSCEPGQPDVCTECNQVEGDHILYESKCYLQCPAGTFFEYFQCKLCDDKCKTCQYTSGTSCTSCQAGSPYPYLNGKDCSDTCNYREFGNALTNMCEDCAYSCDGCVETATKCTSCRQENLDKFFFENKCLNSCPQGYYVDLEARDNVCLPCSENCLTCELTADTCSSCEAGLILNNLDSNCVETCPVDVTIYQPVNATQDYETCEPCKSSCKTCAEDINKCTSCRNPLSLKKSEDKCVLECDVFFQSQVSINNVCVGCSSSCLRCQGTPDYCIKCVEGTYFYENHCVKQCPMVNDYQYYPDENGICYINRTLCTFGYKPVFDAITGEEKCEQINQICEPDYELNAEKTACIPVSTFYVPFPILITTILVCIVPIVSKVKRRNTKIVPNLTVAISFFETLCMIILVGQAYDYGIIPTFYLAVVGFIFLFASNMFFTLMYTQQVVNDSAFKHWQPKWKRTSYSIQACGVFNFKMYRLLYSLLFGRNQFDAPFNEPSLFLRPFNLTSLFAIVTVTLPIIVSSIIGLIYVRWGYQLYITCIEMLVLETALVVLQIVEYIQQRFVQKQYFKVSKKQVEVKVCSDFPDSDENDEYGTKLDKSKSKPKSIKAVRQLNYLVNRMQGKEGFAGEQRREVEQEIEELHVEDMMHRQLRHCQSFRLNRPQLDEAFSGDESVHSEDRFQDFISEPGSPRSKEMLFNRKFIGRMHYLHDVYKMRDQFDNCYHEPVDFTSKNRNPVTRRVQTNVLEMLGIDDARVTADIEQKSEESIQEYVDPLSNNKRKRLSKKRIMEIPDFEFDDIMGEFEADENGQFLLVQKQGRLHDKKGRLVNRRGYLIDQIGNVINRKGKMIFRVDELSAEDDELPDPFCYEKIKVLQSHKHEFQFKVALHSQIVEDKAKLEMQNILIDKAYEETKQKKLSEKQLSSKHMSSGERMESSQSDIQPVQETSVREEEEAFIKRLTQPKEAKTKNQFISAQGRKAQSQISQQRINAASSSDMSEPVFQAMRPPSQTSVHRVEQLQEMIQMKDLQFSNKRSGKNSQRPQQASLNKYVPGQDIAKVYDEDNLKLDSQRQKVLLDQNFLGKMEQFSKQLDSKRKEGKYGDNTASEIAYQMENRGLAHRNLSNVYGRVKQKFNLNMTKETSGPSATINKKVGDKMQELEEIYMRPRVDGREQRQRHDGMQSAIESLDVTKQLQNLHHMKPFNQSVQSNQLSAIDAKSQNQMRDRPTMS